MKKILLRIALVLVGLVLAVGGYFVYQMGPRNIWGMLRYDQREEGALKVGDLAPDVTLVALDGAPVRLHERLGPLGAKPTVIIFGSYT
jgi:hypothetical protein